MARLVMSLYDIYFNRLDLPLSVHRISKLSADATSGYVVNVSKPVKHEISLKLRKVEFSLSKHTCNTGYRLQKMLHHNLP